MQTFFYFVGALECPSPNGNFVNSGSSFCSAYIKCIDGDAIPTTCAGGFHFKESTGECVFPGESGRVGCQEGSLE